MRGPNKKNKSPLQWRLQEAEARGYARGLANKHDEPRTFATGAKYIVWLRGWREGQEVRKAKLNATADQQADVERIMLRMLTQEAA